MKHKRKKTKERLVAKNKSSEYKFYTADSDNHLVHNLSFCDCGLIKGIVKTMGFFPKLAYIKNKKIISIDQLPYSCGGDHIRRNDNYFSEEEFNI